MRAEPVERTEDLADAMGADESAADNRNLVADPASQTMTKEKIMEMRESGATGKEIISTIIDSSASFQGKTEYSQAKYVRKKQKKYFEFISVQEPTVRLVASMYYMQDPLKIMNLRLDSLSQLLTGCSARPGGRYLVLESGCLAVTVAAVLERLGGHGSLVHLFQGGTPQRHAVDAINFTADQLACLSCLDLPTLMAHHPADSAPVTAAATPVTAAATATAADATTATTATTSTTAAAASATAATAAAATGPEPASAAASEASSQPETPGEQVSAHNGHMVAQTDGDHARPATAAAPAAAGADPVAPSVGDDVTMAEEGVKTAETAEAEQDVKAPAEARKRRLSEDETGATGRKSKYARTRSEDSELALRLLSARDMDGLLLCCRQHPLNLLRYLLRFLAVSRPFAVFCPYKEPLLECYFAMKAEGCIMLKVTETWLRNYQVLPERTHPEINMSGGGGYILSGFKVDRSLNKTVATD